MLTVPNLIFYVAECTIGLKVDHTTTYRTSGKAELAKVIPVVQIIVDLFSTSYTVTCAALIRPLLIIVAVNFLTINY
jgi:hypothetical protein